MAIKMSNVKNIREDLYIGPRIPQGLTAAIEGLTKEILRHRPEDIYDFAANHFEKLLELRKQYDETNENNSQESDRQKIINEVDKKASEKLCDCKKKHQSFDEAALQSSGWSLNETAKVLKRHRSIFGDTGKKISLDEIYDLANAKSTANLSSTKKDQPQKSKSHKKHEKREERSESTKRPSDDSSEEKKHKSDKNKKPSSQKKKVTSEETHFDHTKKIQNDKIESFESSTKISNIQEINYSSETRKMSIEESQSSSYIHKVYEIHETKSVMKEKVQESKHFNGKPPKTEPSGFKEPASFSSGMSNKFSKSATCLSKSEGLKKSDAFESKLKETQNLLEKISTNLNQTMRRSISARDLRRVSQSSDFSEPKPTESSSASKLRQISLPTVRPFSATKSDFLKKFSLNGADDGLTLPIISQKPNKSPKQSDNGLTLPKLSPSNTAVPSSRPEGQDENFTIIRDIDKKIIDISENKIDSVKTYNLECQQSINICEKIEMKSSSSTDSKDGFMDKDTKTETTETDVRGGSEKKTEDEVPKRSLTKNMRSAKIEETKSIRSESREKNESESSELSSSSIKSRSKRVESKDTFAKKRSESARSVLSKDTNKEGKTKITKTKSADSSGFRFDSQNVRIEKDQLKEKMKTKSAEEDRIHRCPSHDCNKSINNNLLRSRLEELVKAEQLILQGSESEDKVVTREINETTETETKTEQNEKTKSETDTGQEKSSRDKLASGKSSSKSESEKQTTRSFRDEKHHSNDKSVKIQQIDDNVFAYILTEGSPCEIPDTVTTVIFPDSTERNSTDVEINIEEVDNEVLTSIFGEEIDYEETIYEPMLNSDFKALKNVHDISLLRQDLHRIKEEEEEEENDISANEDSTIVLDRILESQDVDESQKLKDDKESVDMSLQEFLLHCTLNESTEETSINDNTDDAVMPFVPELNLKVIEDATESTSKTSQRKSAGGGSVDEIENSVLQSERTFTSNNELEGSTRESLTGDQQPTTRDETSLQLDTNFTDSPKSSTSALSYNEKLLRAVTIIQKAFKRYKLRKQARKEQQQSSSRKSTERKSVEKEETKIEQLISTESRHEEESSSDEKKSLGNDAKGTTAKMLLIDEIADAIVKIQKCYRNYKSRVHSESVKQEDNIKSVSDVSAEKSIREKEVKSAGEISAEKSIRQEEVKSASEVSSEKSITQEEVKTAIEISSAKSIRQEEVKSASDVSSTKSIRQEETVKSASEVLPEKSITQEKVKFTDDASSESSIRQEQVKSISEVSSETSIRQAEEVKSAGEISPEKSIRQDEVKSVSEISSEKSNGQEEEVKSASKVSSAKSIRQEEKVKSASEVSPEKSTEHEEKDESASQIKSEKIVKQEEAAANKQSFSTLNTMVHAALTIQRYYRKYKTRKSSKITVSENITNSSKIEKEEKLEKTLSSKTVSKNDSVTIESSKMSSEGTKLDGSKLENTETVISKEKETASKIDLQKESQTKISSESAEMVEKISSHQLAKIESHKHISEQKIKSATIDEMVIAAIKIQKLYRRYKSMKEKKSASASAKNVPSTSSFQLQHTGEFHDCIPLSVLDSLPKLNRSTQSENRSKSEGNSGDHRRTRREWNQNRPVSPSFLYPSGFARSMSEGNAAEAGSSDTPRSSRFPGMMIYADSLKSTYRHRTVKQPVESEAQNFMNFVVFSGEEPVINFMAMKSTQSRDGTEAEKEVGFTEPENAGVIIEEINNDDDLSKSNK